MTKKQIIEKLEALVDISQPTCLCAWYESCPLCSPEMSAFKDQIRTIIKEAKGIKDTPLSPQEKLEMYGRAIRIPESLLTDTTLDFLKTPKTRLND